MEIIALLISIASAIIAVAGWKRQRIIFDVEMHNFLSGERGDIGNKTLKEKLTSGNYTILHTQQEQLQYGLGPDFKILLGKIKK